MRIRSALAGLCLALSTHASADTWSGPYLGLLAGAGFGSGTTSVRLQPNTGASYWMNSDDAAQINALPAGQASSAAAVGGISAGYRRQLSQWVVGLDADLSAMALTESTYMKGGYDTVPGGYNTYLKEYVRTDWLITLRPQLGYAIGAWLLQGSAGLALANRQIGGSWEDENYPALTPQYIVKKDSSDLAIGFAAGLGAEFSLGEHVSVGLDYLFVKFPKAEIKANDGIARTNGGNWADEFTFGAELSAQVLRLGLRYRL